MQPQQVETATMRIQNIAKRRCSAAFKGLLIVVLISVLILFFTDIELIPILVLTFIICVYLIILAIVNYNNSKNLHDGYRWFNRFFYTNLAWVMKIFSVLSLIKSILSYFNPMGGFKNASYDRGSLAGEGLASVAGISIAQKIIKESNEVEALFEEKIQQSQNIASSNIV